MREIVCDLDSQKGRKIFVVDRITMGQVRKVSQLEAQIKDGFTEDLFEKLYTIYARLIPRWEFEDDEGEFPQPGDDLWAFDRLSVEEFKWLSSQVFQQVAKPRPPTG